jgi:hypothetical protein
MRLCWKLIQQELMKRCTKSETRGRKATSAEVIPRVLRLKHLRNWSLEMLSREVRRHPGLSRVHPHRRR